MSDKLIKAAGGIVIAMKVLPFASTELSQFGADLINGMLPEAASAD